MKGPFGTKWLALAGIGVLLCGTAFALSKGDSLISKSYLEETFIPSMVSQGTEISNGLLEETYEDAVARLESISRGEGDGESTYSADFSQRELGRGDRIYLETGSGFYMMSGGERFRRRASGGGTPLSGG